MRIVAILAAFNEERFIGGCLEHLFSHGVEVYLIDNSSTDRTVEIAEAHLGRGLIGVETLPRVGGVHRWHLILRRKEELAASLDADWFMHADPDEIRLPPSSNQTLAEAFAEVDAHGYNAVNFLEFTFIPTREAPEHDHPDFMQTMRWYYPFTRQLLYRVNAWKRQPEPVNLRFSGGHRVRFPELCVYPEPFKMKHYQFLSLEQARVKYLEKKRYDVAQVQKRDWRHWLVEERMGLPSESELNFYTSDDELSLAKPRVRHVMEDWALPEADRELPEHPGGSEEKVNLPGRASSREREAPLLSKVSASGQLLVAGFHRSGTSLTADLLRRSGVFLGHDLLLENRSQPRGHFEDREIKRLHDEILAYNGLTWHVDGSSLPAVGEEHRRRMLEIVEKREAEQGIWGFKDPQVCLFLDTWKSLLPDAKVLLVYRHFAECTRSLHRRAANGILRGIGRGDHHRRFWEVPDLALKMWLAYNRALIDFADAYPEDVLAVSFSMLRGGFPLVEALNRYWGLTLAETPTRDVFDPEASLEPLRRQLVSEEKLISETLDTWEALERLGRRTGELTGIPVKASERPTERAFYMPTDAYTSELKREISGFELDYARECLGEAEHARDQLQEQLAEMKKVQSRLEARLENTRKRVISPKRRSELQAADKDLKLILKRMSESKAAPLLRLKHEFVELERKYLD